MTADHVLSFIAGWSCAVLATAYLRWRDGKDES